MYMLLYGMVMHGAPAAFRTCRDGEFSESARRMPYAEAGLRAAEVEY